MHVLFFQKLSENHKHVSSCLYICKMANQKWKSVSIVSIGHGCSCFHLKLFWNGKSDQSLTVYKFQIIFLRGTNVCEWKLNWRRTQTRVKLNETIPPMHSDRGHKTEQCIVIGGIKLKTQLQVKILSIILIEFTTD